MLVALDRLPRFPCISSDNCLLHALFLPRMFAATPPLFTYSEGILQAAKRANPSTIRTGLGFHFDSRQMALDWAASTWHACTYQGGESELVTPDCNRAMAQPPHL
jgi:hypothetical protein